MRSTSCRRLVRNCSRSQRPDGSRIFAALLLASRMTACNSRSRARLKAFRAMPFSAADHFKSCVAVPAPEGGRLGRLVIFRSSKAAFYLGPLIAEKRVFSNDARPHPIRATYRKSDFSGRVAQLGAVHRVTNFGSIG